jgi:hypothetical protein
VIGHHHLVEGIVATDPTSTSLFRGETPDLDDWIYESDDGDTSAVISLLRALFWNK